MSTRKLIGKVSATEKNPSSCDEFQFWMSDDTILSPFDIVLVQNKTDDSITYGVVQDIFHITDGTGHISNYVSSDFGNVDIVPMTRRLSLSYTFRPEHLGQLNFYLEALDRDVKKPNENPSVGLVLCTGKDDTVVEYALSRSMSPTMVADYTLHLPDKAILQSKLRELTELALEGGEDDEGDEE